jgi:predicted nucleic acid-binding protein
MSDERVRLAVCELQPRRYSRGISAASYAVRTPTVSNDQNKNALHQRQVSHPDLLIAAAAESAGIPVLHYDEDYDRIEAITGQAMRWVRPRGSLE